MDERTSLAAVSAAYTLARGRAMGAPTVWLRWHSRRLERRHDRLDPVDLARLRAIRHELHERVTR